MASESSDHWHLETDELDQPQKKRTQGDRGWELEQQEGLGIAPTTERFNEEDRVMALKVKVKHSRSKGRFGSQRSGSTVPTTQKISIKEDQDRPILN